LNNPWRSLQAAWRSSQHWWLPATVPADDLPWLSHPAMAAGVNHGGACVEQAGGMGAMAGVGEVVAQQHGGAAAWGARRCSISGHGRVLRERLEEIDMKR
jgi:hypothetical protein